MIHTEALTSIDINSARATKGEDIEETAFNTNLEAADEIARQLRLRDLGGLFVIDFIDMTSNRNQRDVENRLRDGLKVDRARVQTGRISRFGLLEMSRQRLRPSLGESSHIPCPRCDGQGTIRGIKSLSLSVLRIVQEEAMKELTAKVVAQLPVEAATFLLNEKRQDIREIEQRLDVEIIISPNPSMETPQYLVQRISLSESETDSSRKESYKFAEERQDNAAHAAVSGDTRKAPEKPALTQVMPERPAPSAKEGKEKGLISRLIGGLFNHAEAPEKQEPPAKPRKTQTSRSRGRGRNSGSSSGRQQQRRGSRRGENSAGNNQRRQGNRDQSGSDNRQSRSGSRNRNTREKKQTNETAKTGAPPRQAADKKGTTAPATSEE